MNNDINIKMLTGDKNYILKLLSKLENFSQETYVHSIDVANKCVEMGKKLNLSIQDLQSLYTAGLLHDIGKMDLDKMLLEKQHCTKEELDQIKFGHIQGTKRYLLGKVDKTVFCIAYHHHEKMNGTGYPQGIKGEQISNLDKILQVCDVTSALSMQRSYRSKLSNSEIDKILDNWVVAGELDMFYVGLVKKLFVKTLDEEKEKI